MSTPTPEHRYQDIHSLAEFLTQCRVDGVSRGFLMALTDDVLVPYWKGEIISRKQQTLLRVCENKSEPAGALSSLISRPSIVQGFALLRMALGEASFHRHVTKTLGTKKAHALYAAEMSSLNGYQSFVDVQAVLLAHTHVGRFSQGMMQPPEFQSKEGVAYTELEILSMLNTLHKIVGFKQGDVPLLRGEHNDRDVRTLLTQLTSSMNLRHAVAEIYMKRESPHDLETFRRLRASDVFEHIPEWRAEAQKRLHLLETVEPPVHVSDPRYEALQTLWGPIGVGRSAK